MRAHTKYLIRGSVLRAPRIETRSRSARLVGGVLAAVAMFVLVLALAAAIAVTVLVLAPIIAVRLAINRFALVSGSD